MNHYALAVHVLGLINMTIHEWIWAEMSRYDGHFISTSTEMFSRGHCGASTPQEVDPNLATEAARAVKTQWESVTWFQSLTLFHFLFNTFSCAVPFCSLSRCLSHRCSLCTFYFLCLFSSSVCPSTTWYLGTLFLSFLYKKRKRKGVFKVHFFCVLFFCFKY